MFIKLLIILFFLTLPSCNNTERSLVIVDALKIDASTGLMYSVIGDMVFTSLLYEKNDLVVHSTLAEDIRLLPGGKAVEIGIRKGVRFHDGREMTPGFVAASFNGTMERFGYLKEKYGIFKAVVRDEFKIMVASERPLSDVNILLLNIPVYSSDLIGTGPYKFHKWLDNGVELAANNDYFEGTPKLKKVVYRYEPDERKRVNMLLKGEADLLVWLSPETADFLKKESRFYVNELPSEFYSAIFLNNESPLFRDKALRLAVSMAINRDALIQKVLKGGGIKISTPLPPRIFKPEKNKTDTDYRPKEAVRLLKDAGWRDSNGDGILEKDGRKLQFRLYYNVNAEEFKKMADIISQDLFEIGIGVEAVPADMKESTDRNFEAGSYDAVLEAKSSYDSVNIAVWGSSSIFNMSRFNNREMDGLLEGLKEATDIGQKKEVYTKMQRIFEEETPAVFLYNTVIFTAVSKRFKGAEDFVGNVYSIYKIKDWSINEDYR